MPVQKYILSKYEYILGIEGYYMQKINYSEDILNDILDEISEQKVQLSFVEDMHSIMIDKPIGRLRR